jgi:hypothetical protein
MNLPPIRRAKSQLKRAVLAPQTCRYPVGDGAKRVTTIVNLKNCGKHMKRLSYIRTVVKNR